VALNFFGLVVEDTGKRAGKDGKDGGNRQNNQHKQQGVLS
jgi:hypothetical protein